MTSERLGEMFKGDSADTYSEKFPLVSKGGRVDPSSVRRWGARTPIGVSGNLDIILQTKCPLSLFSKYKKIKENVLI